MREIEFRGKDIKTKEWHYGSLVSKYDVEACLYCQYHILEKSEYSRSCDWDSALADVDFYEVDEDTLGQFTGLCDKNEKKIFEGDIVLVGGVAKAKIIWNTEDACFAFDYGTDGRPLMLDLVNDTSIEVIGNIYDNHELVKE